MPIFFASSSITPSTPKTICGTHGARKEFTLGRLEATSNDSMKTLSKS